jgi:hypothetical protein
MTRHFSSYPVSDYLIVLHLPTLQSDPSRADTTSLPMSLMAWTRSSRTRSLHGSILTSQQRPVRRRRGFEGSPTGACVLEHNGENHKLGDSDVHLFSSPELPGAFSPSLFRRNKTSLNREMSVVLGPARAMVLLWEFCSSTRSQIRDQVVPDERESDCSRGTVSRVPCGDLESMFAAALDSKEDPLVFSDVPLFLASVILVESVNCAFRLGDGLLTFRLGCSVTRLDGLLLLFTPLSGKVHQYLGESRGR